MPVNDVRNMKVADLKRELKVRGLSTTGVKNELQERLQAAMEGEPLLEDSSITEDILDEEEGVLSDEEKILGSDENELLKSPTTTPTSNLPKPITSENQDIPVIGDDILDLPNTTAKKIVLKRKSSINNGSVSVANAMTKENTEPSPAKTFKMSERNPITIGELEKTDINKSGTTVTKKLKELTMQERLELRAKKFGIEPKTTATAKEKNSAISMAPVVSSEKQLELLKKRAERFGCVTSTNLAKIDAEEKLIKRKQRFGDEINSSMKPKAAENDTTSTTKSNVISGNSDEWAERARKRLERFKSNSTTTAVVASTAAPTTVPAGTTTTTTT